MAPVVSMKKKVKVESLGGMKPGLAPYGLLFRIPTDDILEPGQTKPVKLDAICDRPLLFVLHLERAQEGLELVSWDGVSSAEMVHSYESRPLVALVRNPGRQPVRLVAGTVLVRGYVLDASDVELA